MSKINHFYQDPQFEEDWFTYPELYKFAVARYPTGSTFVELGSWKGRSSSFMCVEIANSKKNINFFCVDTWAGSQEHTVASSHDLYLTFLHNMKSVKNLFVPLKLTTLEASRLFEPNSVDFVFVDASHEYQDVVNDIHAWWPLLKNGGLLAGHDYDDNWPGVKKAVEDSFEQFIVNEGCWAVFK